MPGGQKPQPSELNGEVGRIIAGALARRGLKPPALAEAMTISRSQVWKLINGQKHWDLDQLDAACAFLGLDTVEVIDEADRATPDRPRPAPAASAVRHLRVVEPSIGDEEELPRAARARDAEPMDEQ